MRHYLSLLFILLLYGAGFSLTLVAKTQASEVKILSRQYLLGDDPQFKSVDLADQHWHTLHAGFPELTSNFWLRFHVRVDPQATQTLMGIRSSAVASYELYWDGVLIGRSGVVGQNRDTEVAGPLDLASPIPVTLYTPGKHVISMRMSNYHSVQPIRGQHMYFWVGSFEKVASIHHKRNAVPIMILGGLLIIALYCLQLHFIYARDTALLLFSLLCFVVSALLVAEIWRGTLGYAYPWQLPRLRAINLLTFLVACLLPLFLLYHFALKHKQKIMAGLIVVLLCVEVLVRGYDEISIAMFTAAFVLSLAITLYAWRLGKQGTKQMAVAIFVILLGSLINPERFADIFFFPCFAVLIFIVLNSLTLRMKQIQNERDAAQLNSAQLEVMLLKKNIQPQFILNTLTSIEQWIEESPQTAIRFIDALADEFRLMNAMADQKQVPLKQELELCRSHLQIMSYRKDMTFTLVTQGVDPQLLLPPAILHTLIENALTHNFYYQGEITLTLSQAPGNEGQGIVLALRAPLSQSRGQSKGQSKSANKTRISTGTGLKYIEARLEQSYPGLWCLEASQTDEYWQTKISLNTLGVS
ncbi:MAG: hypothetical protein ACI8WB_000792 [Phenylobacterium sp.]|jgi:hypothetical protein